MKDHNIFSSKKHPSHVAQWLRCRFKYLELQGSGVRVPARGVIPTRSLMAIDRFPRGPGGGANLISLLISEASDKLKRHRKFVHEITDQKLKFQV